MQIQPPGWHDSPPISPRGHRRPPVPLDDCGHQLRQLLHLEGRIGRRQQGPHRHLPTRARVRLCLRLRGHGSPGRRRRRRCCCCRRRRLFAAARRHLPFGPLLRLPPSLRRGFATGPAPPPGREGGSDVAARGVTRRDGFVAGKRRHAGSGAGTCAERSAFPRERLYACALERQAGSWGRSLLSQPGDVSFGFVAGPT